MNEALAALDVGRVTEAEAALEAASRLFPDDPAVHNARQRLSRSRQQARLLELRRSAQARVKAENWEAAAALYEKALAVEPGAAFAREGLAQARERGQLHAQLDHYLAEPARLYSAEPLANARQVLAAAGEAPAGESRLAQKIAALTRHVSQASAPIPITLRSDGETEVVIYRVGPLGRFQEQRMELKPGTYTVVGSRAGYRDVRQVFTLRPGMAPPALFIRCEEPI
jgi:tetratricopeptide (TPR) repeat protein